MARGIMREEDKIHKLSFFKKQNRKTGRYEWRAEEHKNGHCFIYLPRRSDLKKYFKGLSGEQVCAFNVILAAGKSDVVMIVKIKEILPKIKGDTNVRRR